MAYDEKLAQRVRQTLAQLPHVEEKKMFSGLAFLVNDKMCINVSGDELMLRFDPALTEEMKAKKGFRKMIMNNREYKGYGFVSQEVLKTKKDFDYWIDLALAYNKHAKSSKTKTKTKKKS